MLLDATDGHTARGSCLKGAITPPPGLTGQDAPARMMAWREGSINAARRVLRNFAGGTAGGKGRGLACREASGNTRSPVERGALC